MTNKGGSLIERLRTRGNVLMPEWAAVSSGYFYNHGGRQYRDDARLLREAAARIEELELALIEARNPGIDVEQVKAVRARPKNDEGNVWQIRGF